MGNKWDIVPYVHVAAISHDGFPSCTLTHENQDNIVRISHKTFDFPTPTISFDGCEELSCGMTHGFQSKHGIDEGSKSEATFFLCEHCARSDPPFSTNSAMLPYHRFHECIYWVSRDWCHITDCMAGFGGEWVNGRQATTPIQRYFSGKWQTQLHSTELESNGECTVWYVVETAMARRGNSGRNVMVMGTFSSHVAHSIFRAKKSDFLKGLFDIFKLNRKDKHDQS